MTQTTAHMHGCPYAQANPSPCPYCDGVDAERAAAPEQVVLDLAAICNALAIAEATVIVGRDARDGAIISAKAAGMSVEDIALTTGLSVQRVYQIVSR